MKTTGFVQSAIIVGNLYYADLKNQGRIKCKSIVQYDSPHGHCAIKPRSAGDFYHSPEGMHENKSSLWYLARIA